MADQPVTIEKLIKADIDADNLGKAANELGIVNPRYGNPYKTAPQTIQDMQQKADQLVAQGFYKGYTTEALLLADKPAVAEMRARADDTRKIYRWNRTSAEGVTPVTGVWVDTGLSDIDKAKEIVKEEVGKVDSKIPHYPFDNEILFEFADAEGEVVFQINRDGSALFIGLQESIQKEISNIFEKIQNNISENLCELIDREGNIVFIIDSEAKVYIPGLEADLVTAINSKAENGLSIKDTSNLSNYSYRDTFIPKAQSLLNFFRNNQDVGLLAPVPLQSFEQNFSIGTDWINQANITEWGNYIPVETPYGQNRGVVHPQILEFPNKFMGHRYILAITGYTNGDVKEENPFLLGSNDLESFELLTPLIDQPEFYTWEKGVVYNSDPFMFYDIKTGELCLIFREYWADTSGGSPSQTHEFLYIRRTKDGKTWSERELMWGNQAGTVMSPAVIYDVNTETYHMYAVGRSNGSAYGLLHMTSKTLKNDWSLVGLITPPLDSSVWHVDVKIIGDKQVLTFQNRVGSTSVGFKTGIASDFHTFTWAENWWNPPTYEVYKASFLPQFNDQNEMRLVYVWTTNHKPTAPLNYKLFVQPTPFLNVEFLEKQPCL